MQQIGRHKYFDLISRDNLSKSEKKQVSEYEKQLKPKEKKLTKAEKEYWGSVYDDSVREDKTFTSSGLLMSFNHTYEKQNSVKWSTEKLDMINLYTLIYYFTQDERFFNSPHLIKRVELPKKRTLEPSFEKGLLIIGGFGTGKTSSLKSIAEIFKTTRDKSFAFHTVNDIVEAYEGCQDASEKQSFWKRMKGKRIAIDDVKKERMASNFGKSNLIQEILQSRYNSRLKTYITCNYEDGRFGDVEMGLMEFGKRYGGYILDRLFQDYNIIEFKGGTKRR